MHPASIDQSARYSFETFISCTIACTIEWPQLKHMANDSRRLDMIFLIVAVVFMASIIELLVPSKFFWIIFKKNKKVNFSEALVSLTPAYFRSMEGALRAS